MVLKQLAKPNRLKVLRAERGATQIAVAKLVGMGHNRYWHIENGHTDPTVEERKALSKVLGVPQADIWQAVA